MLTNPNRLIAALALTTVTFFPIRTRAQEPLSESLWTSPQSIRVAAVQLEAELGEVDRNLQRCERLVGEAFAQGAQWVVLPEMFTSAMAVHPKMLDAVRPSDGEPFEFLVRLARKHQGVVGGSFLAFRGGNAYNTFVLAFPDGRTFFHDKDEPTLWENRYYIAGNDDGVLDTPAGGVGVALCAEMFRTRTVRRLLNRVGIVLAGSCWWTAPDDAENAGKIDAGNRALLRASPQKLARLLGVPVVHASHAGRFEGYVSGDDTAPYRSRYLGETQIVDGRGQVLARLGPDDGEGVILADIEAGRIWSPRAAVPPGPWMTPVPPLIALNWFLEAGQGARYYKATTLPHLIRALGATAP